MSCSSSMVSSAFSSDGAAPILRKSQVLLDGLETVPTFFWHTSTHHKTRWVPPRNVTLLFCITEQKVETGYRICNRSQILREAVGLRCTVPL
jgi:hypothetical protein